MSYNNLARPVKTPLSFKGKTLGLVLACCFSFHVAANQTDLLANVSQVKAPANADKKVQQVAIVNSTSKLKKVAADVEASEALAPKDIVLSEDESNSRVEDNIEIIGVFAQTPLLFFKKQMEIAELDFYESFNAIADEDKFRVKCRLEAKVGSRIKKRVCYPRYVLDRMAQETQNALSSGSPYPTLEEIEFLVKRDKEEALVYAENIVKENPELLQKLVKMNEKQEKYQSKRTEYFDDGE
jgi:hypothetical protein